MQTLKNPNVGTAEDKLRLFIIYYLTSSDLPDSELQQYIDTLQVLYFLSLKYIWIIEAHFFL